MLFLKHIAKELIEEDSVIRWELRADLDSGRLVLTESSVINGAPHHTWTFSVLSTDLDPQRISLQPEDSSGLCYLTAISAFYRKAVEGTCVFSNRSPRREQFVKLSLPLSRDLADLEQSMGRFRDFLPACGARPPVIRLTSIRDLLAPLHDALAPAAGVRISNQAGTDWCEYATRLDEDQLLLKREMRRGQRARQTWSFELLSLDTAAVDVRKGVGCWDVTLPSVERIETTLWEISPAAQERWWYMQVVFPSQAQAEHFAAVCNRVVPEMRQRLYEASFQK